MVCKELYLLHILESSGVEEVHICLSALHHDMFRKLNISCCVVLCCVVLLIERRPHVDAKYPVHTPL